MSSVKKRNLSQSPHRSSEPKCKSLHEGKRGKYIRDESESSFCSSSISSSDASPERKSHRKKKDRKRKHRHRSSSSDSSPKRKKKKKEKKKKKDKKKKKKKHKTDKTEKHKIEDKMCKTPVNKSINLAVNESNKGISDSQAAGPSPRVMKPMTKEEWEKQQSIVRRVYDPETGRNRLVKGDGEIIEEIVSKDRHRDINKQATRGDGAFYQATLGIQDK